MAEKVFIGLDIGTQGVRCIAATASGEVLAGESQAFSSLDLADSPERKEQRPEDWWAATCAVLQKVTSQVDAEVAALSLDGTSGSVVPVDDENRPIGNALMYNDARSAGQARRLSPVASAHQARHGYRFNASYALPKIMWCLEHGVPAHRFLNQADYIVGRLTGEYGVTDYSNALKMGYDLIEERWPDFLGQCGVEQSMLPEVVPCGASVGRVTAVASRETGLHTGITVCAGATDGYASSLAAGLARPGQWASVLGTTLVLKGITASLVLDPQGRIYSHKHPGGWWMPGGASNIGGRCLNEQFGRENFEWLNQTVDALTPTGCLHYPLTMRGERFPFVNPNAEAFFIGHTEDVRVQYAAAMEGVGYVERLCYDMLAGLGCEVGSNIFTAGGACRSAQWLRVRASILGKTLKAPANIDAAMGSAMLAASAAHFSNLSEAVEAMCRIVKIVDPDARKTEKYSGLYAQFREEVSRRFGLV